ncbi:DNA recombination protein RmuC [Candidatus Micrarchaeota archaeon]|nr:DNA recombination protein RmuC [Candidatus Micrarchaeota archaeon]
MKMETLFVWILIFLVGMVVGGLLSYLVLFRPGSRILNQRLQNMESELRNALEIKARAEQEAKRIPELDQQLTSLRSQATEWQTEIAALKTHQEADKEKIQWVKEAEAYLREAFQSLAAQTLQGNAEEFLKRAKAQLETLLLQVRGDWSVHKVELQNLVQPLENALSGLDNQIRELEQKREGAYQGLQEQLHQQVETVQQLQKATISLDQALKSPIIRGRWGEYQLRRLVEMAGMVSHIDFQEQVGTDEGRPDAIIYLPNKGVLPVDAKTPMQAYFEAVEATDEQTRTSKFNEHTRVMRETIRGLGQRHYWQQFERTPEMVIMFVPNEACLSVTFERDPGLLDFAIGQRVIPATPITFLALLTAVAYGWQQHQVAENARQIALQGKELYDRLRKFIEHLQRTGKELDSAVRAYNEEVCSLDSRLFPAARKFKELAAIAEEIPLLAPIESQARGLVSLEATEDKKE